MAEDLNAMAGFAAAAEPKGFRAAGERLGVLQLAPHPRRAAYRWEFTEDGRDFSVDVGARVLTNDPALNVRLARTGAGVTLGDESRVRGGVASGELVPVLEEFSTPFPAFYPYSPQRRHASP